jgi:Transcriptional regulator, AbiEi antitoxin
MATTREQLWEVALDQYGYVTQGDARDLGIDRVAVDMLSTRGQLERVAHGVYRFPHFPVTAYDPYMLAVLWTGARAACLSHDTALAALRCATSTRTESTSLFLVRGASDVPTATCMSSTSRTSATIRSAGGSRSRRPHCRLRCPNASLVMSPDAFFAKPSPLVGAAAS